MKRSLVIFFVTIFSVFLARSIVDLFIDSKISFIRYIAILLTTFFLSAVFIFMATKIGFINFKKPLEDDELVHEKWGQSTNLDTSEENGEVREVKSASHREGKD